MLLACLRGVGLSQAQVPWQTSLAAYAFVRLLTVLPLTPGGLGITELGLVGVLAAGAGPRASAQVTAAVLLYRAVTYLPPIPLGAATFLLWRHAPALIHPTPPSAPSNPADKRRTRGSRVRQLIVSETLRNVIPVASILRRAWGADNRSSCGDMCCMRHRGRAAAHPAAAPDGGRHPERAVVT